MTMTKLPTYCGASGMTVNHIFDGHILLCGKCSNHAIAGNNMSTFINDVNDNVPYIHYEGDSLYCEECDAEIESEYGPIDDE